MKLKKGSAHIKQKNTRIPFPVPGEYLIVRPDPTTGRMFLVRTMSVEGAKKGVITQPKDIAIQARYESNVTKPNASQLSDIDPNHIVMNLGAQPAEGKSVLGVRLDIFHGKAEHELADVYKFVSISKTEQKLLLKAMDTVQQLWSDAKLPELDMRMELRRPMGKWAGSYRTTREGEQDILILRDVSKVNLQRLYYYLLHEMGHGLDHHFVPVSLRVEWIDKYHEQVKVVQAEKSKLLAVCKEFLRYGEQYDPDGEDKNLFDQACTYIKDKHLLGIKDLKLALNTMAGHTLIQDIWPKREDMTNKNPTVTEYALVNPAEFFAESFSFYMSNLIGGKHTLPKDISKLVKRTIAACKVE